MFSYPVTLDLCYNCKVDYPLSKKIGHVKLMAQNWRIFGSRFISRAVKTENPLPRSFFAPKPNRNACYAGYDGDGDDYENVT